jgi:hypothetical protein
MTRKPPMTKQEAIKIIAIMRKETPANAMRKIIEIALGPHGNLSDEARAVYQAA